MSALDEIRVKYQYTTHYNFRPDELYGMGKESLTISHNNATLREFLDVLVKNSQLKHTNAVYQFYGLDERIEEFEPWVPWIGQPMFHLSNISFEILN